MVRSGMEALQKVRRLKRLCMVRAAYNGGYFVQLQCAPQCQ